jgi:hypothetical protein
LERRVAASSANRRRICRRDSSINKLRNDLGTTTSLGVGVLSPVALLVLDDTASEGRPRRFPLIEERRAEGIAAMPPDGNLARLLLRRPEAHA